MSGIANGNIAQAGKATARSMAIAGAMRITDEKTGERFSDVMHWVHGDLESITKDSTQEYLDGRQHFTSAGRGSGNSPSMPEPSYETNLSSRLQRTYREQGFSPSEARARAATQVQQEMQTLAALHNPDMVASGANAITGRGDRGVNSSIGSQWKG